jgi:hypothetical protein
MGAAGADHLLPVVITNPRGSSVLRMNEPCEPHRQRPMPDSARQGCLSGIFHEALIIPGFPLVQGIKALQIRTLGAGALAPFSGDRSPRSEPSHRQTSLAE